MDFESELVWHIAAIGRLAREAHNAAVAADENRRVYALDDVSQAVVDIFAAYGLRNPPDFLADAIETHVRIKAAEGDSRAKTCLERYYPDQPVPETSDLNSPDGESTDKT